MHPKQTSRYTMMPPVVASMELHIVIYRDGHFGTLSEVINDTQFVSVMTNRSSKLTKAIRRFKTTGSHIASLFMVNWIVPYKIPTDGLIENQTQFTGTFLETLCSL